jgi:ribonuclease-3 family protein
MNKNILVLAYLGDSVFELYVRKFLIEKFFKVNTLQKEAIKIVSAKGQDNLIKKLINDNVLTQEELDIFNRGRNAKCAHHPKNTDIITYKYATGFEALIGYLYLENKERLEEIISLCLEEIECMYMEKM